MVNFSSFILTVLRVGHFLGLPDLYDGSGDGSGIGYYGLMSDSWGVDGTQYYPPHMCPWSKTQLGWVTPVVLTQSGLYELEDSAETTNVYRVNLYAEGSSAGDEYLLIENRQAKLFDAILPQSGLAIWHIDDQADDYITEGYPGQSGWPENGNHYRVALLQADGDYDMEQTVNHGDAGDIWHGGS